VVPDAVAQLRIDGLPSGADARQALDGLSNYSHVWLLWAANLNGKDAVQSKVYAPKLRGGRAGLFATRSPYRPNPIGLSLVRLVGIDGDTLRLAGADLVDGTPVVDVKPYIPAYDAPPPSAGAAAVTTPSWIDPPPLSVRFTPQAEHDLCLVSGRSGSMLSDAQLRRALTQTLAADPRPLYRWRRERGVGGAEYDVAIDGLRAHCSFELEQDGTEVVVVLRVADECSTGLVGE